MSHKFKIEIESPTIEDAIEVLSGILDARGDDFKTGENVLIDRDGTSVSITKSQAYDPNYGDDEPCKCGHAYCRHFDTYEDMYPVGCKYCYSCSVFQPVDLPDSETVPFYRTPEEMDEYYAIDEEITN